MKEKCKVKGESVTISNCSFETHVKANVDENVIEMMTETARGLRALAEGSKIMMEKATVPPVAGIRIDSCDCTKERTCEFSTDQEEECELEQPRQLKGIEED